LTIALSLEISKNLSQEVLLEQRKGTGPRIEGDSSKTVLTNAEALGIAELYEHDKVVGEEGPGAKAEAKEGDHQGSCSLTFFRSDSLGC